MLHLEDLSIEYSAVRRVSMGKLGKRQALPNPYTQDPEQRDPSTDLVRKLGKREILAKPSHFQLPSHALEIEVPTAKHGSRQNAHLGLGFRV